MHSLAGSLLLASELTKSVLARLAATDGAGGDGDARLPTHITQSLRGVVSVNPAVPQLATVPATWPRKPRLSRWPEAHFVRRWFWIGHPLLGWINLHIGQVIVGGGTSGALFQICECGGGGTSLVGSEKPRRPTIGLPWSPSASAGSGSVLTCSCGLSHPPRKTRGLGGRPR